VAFVLPVMATLTYHAARHSTSWPCSYQQAQQVFISSRHETPLPALLFLPRNTGLSSCVLRHSKPFHLLNPSFLRSSYIAKKNTEQSAERQRPSFIPQQLYSWQLKSRNYVPMEIQLILDVRETVTNIGITFQCTTSVWLQT
jgi:hypothetical protein